MSYHIKYDDISNTGYAVTGQLSQIDTQLAQVKRALKGLVDLDSFKGTTATSIKDYIKEVHYSLLACIAEVTSQYKTRFLLYKDGYYRQIDNDIHAELWEEIFEEIIRFFPSFRDDFNALANSVRGTLSSVSDIIYLAEPSTAYVDRDYEKIYNRVYGLKDKVGTYEAEHSRDLNDFDCLLEALRNSILEWLGKTRSAATYQAGSMLSASSTMALGQALERSFQSRQELAAQIELALQGEEERWKIIELELADERLKQGIADGITATLIIIGGAACIVLTAGMATPLVVAGAVAGGSALYYGAAELCEAGENIYYGKVGDIYSVAMNPVRDTIFAGNQEAYQVWGTTSVIASSAFSIVAGGVTAATTASKAGTSALRAVGVYGGKTVLTAGAGMGGSYVSKEAALALGASDTEANIAGVLGGTFSGMAVGAGAQRIDQAYNLSGYYKPVIKPPEPGSLSDYETRKWYLEQEAKFDKMLDTSKPIEQQAQQAYELRNQVRTTARDSMSDRVAAESLNRTDPHRTWDELIVYYSQEKGYAGDDLYREIIAASQRSRSNVDALHGLNSADFKWVFPNSIPSSYAATEIGVLLGIDE